MTQEVKGLEEEAAEEAGLQEQMQYVEQTELDLERALCKEDLFYLCEEILGYGKIHGGEGYLYQGLAPLHQEMCEFAQRPSLSKLILVPRGHLKTSIVTIGRAIQWIVQDPNVRILLCNESLDVAKAFVGQIRTIFETNDRLVTLFPFLRPEKRDKWSATQIQVDRSQVWKEATVEIAGVESNVVSKHYDKAIFDDLVNNTTIGTKDQLEKTVNWFKGAHSLLNPGAEKIVVGTRWHYADVYGWILEKHSDQYDIFVRKDVDASGKPYFMTVAELERRRADAGPYLYSCLYKNEPVDEESAHFKTSWVQYIERKDLPSNLAIFTTVDPAFTEKDSNPNADDTAIVTCGFDDKGNLYVLDLFAEAVSVGKSIDFLFAIHQYFRPLNIKVETHAMQKVYRYAIEAEAQRRKEWLPISEIQRETSRSKEMRILALQPLFEQRRVYIVRGIRNTDKFLEQYTRFPKAPHDDILDALADHLQNLHWAKGPGPTEPPALTKIERIMAAIPGNRNHRRFVQETRRGRRLVRNAYVDSYLGSE